MLTLLTAISYFLTSLSNINATSVARIESALTSKLWPPLQDMGIKYRVSDKFIRESASHIRNIDSYIRNYISSQCIVSINSFGRDIPTSSMRNPVFLRNFMLLAIPSYQKLYWGPGTLVTVNVTISMDSYLTCPFSRFFKPTYIYSKKNPADKSLSTICFSVDWGQFSKFSKGWNCMVRIFLELNRGETQIRDLVNDENVPMSKLIFPNLRAPSVYIFVDEGEQQWFVDMFCNSQLLFMQFKLQKLPFRSSADLRLSIPQSLITNLEFLNSCPGDLEAQKIFKNTNKDTGKKWKDVETLRTLLHSSNGNMKWELTIFSIVREHVFGNMFRFLLKCGAQINPLKTWEERVSHAYGMIWLAIMANYTVQASSTGFCINGIEVAQKPENLHLRPRIEFGLVPYVKGFHYFPYFAKDPFNDLRFVSCGQRGYSQIPFEQLISIFDKWIWILLLLSIFGMTLLTKIFGHLEQDCVTSRSYLMSSLKVFLEQGDSIYDTKRHIMLGCFVLMAVVISNAYKNTNVYEMIAPRKPIPYEAFQELVTDNFSILTRLASLDFRIIGFDETFSEGLVAGGGFLTKLNSSSMETWMISEVGHVTSSILEGLKATQVPGDANVTESLAHSIIVKSGVRSAARFHSDISSLLESVHRRMQRLEKSFAQVDDLDAFLLNFTNSARMEEENIKMLDSYTCEEALLNCSRTAIILPRHLCRKLFKKVKENGKKSHVFVGKESYSQVEWMFTLEGALPPFLPKRVKGAHETGLWERWSKLVDVGEETTGGGGDDVKATRMDGNVVVIFVVWISGVGVSIVIMMFEFLFGILYVYWERGENVMKLCLYFTFRFRCWVRILTNKYSA